jgi:cell division septal protein FtsQ
MSTLDVKTARLRAAVSSFAVVQEVHASASFPHTLHISVTEQPPVAALVAGSTRTAVAADGVVLGPALLSHALPTISISGPAPATGAHVRAGWSLAALAVLGAAPKPLARVAERVYEGSRGVTVSFHSGLLAYFGDASRARAKWRAFVLVLGDERAASASYVDLRVPERPALGYGSTSAAGEANAAGETESTHESGASLVEALRAGASGESASGESSSGESSREATSGEAAGGEQSSRERSSTSESGSGEGGETSSREGG